MEKDLKWIGKLKGQPFHDQVPSTGKVHRSAHLLGMSSLNDFQLKLNFF